MLRMRGTVLTFPSFGEFCSVISFGLFGVLCVYFMLKLSYYLCCWTISPPTVRHIPKASGTTAKETLSDCYGLVRTEMIKPPSSLEVIKQKNVLNVDLTTPDSVEAAKRDRVADLGLADVFVSQLSLDASTIFTAKHVGRAFTIMRHPVKLAASLFYYRRIATWEPTYRPDYKDMTLQQYVEMEGYYDNWMVRMLTNAKLGGLNEGHLELAKLILKKKFIIGISDHMDETFRHLEIYYGWAENKEGCVNFHLHSAPSNKNKYPSPERGNDAWNAIAEKNKFDMALYYYALELCEFMHYEFLQRCLLSNFVLIYMSIFISTLSWGPIRKDVPRGEDSGLNKPSSD